MPDSSPSSPSCSGCRIDWRPSRGHVAALVLLAVLAAYSVSASAIPGSLRTPLAGMVLLQGLALARRMQRQPACSVEPGPGATALLTREGATIALTGIDVEFRGPLVRLQGRDHGGLMHRLVWWPDTLAPAERRALSLALRADRPADTTLPSMAA